MKKYKKKIINKSDSIVHNWMISLLIILSIIEHNQSKYIMNDNP